MALCRQLTNKPNTIMANNNTKAKRIKLAKEIGAQRHQRAMADAARKREEQERAKEGQK